MLTPLQPPLHRGVYTHRLKLFILSIAHTEEDIEQTVKAFGDSLDAMVAEGTLNQTGISSSKSLGVATIIK